MIAPQNTATGPGPVVKKLRKQSHLKHNSIDRSHLAKQEKSTDKLKTIKAQNSIQPNPEQIKPKKSSEHSQIKSFDNRVNRDSFENNLKNLNDNFKGSQGTSGQSHQKPSTSSWNLHAKSGSNSFGQERTKKQGTATQRSKNTNGPPAAHPAPGSPLRPTQPADNSKKSKKSSDPSNSISKLAKPANAVGGIIFATQGLDAPTPNPAKGQPTRVPKQRGAYKSFDYAFKSNLAQKPMTKETLKQSILQNQKNHLKVLVNSIQKNSNGMLSKKDNMLQLFNTEDNRSSLGQPISGWPSGGPSYGVSAGGIQKTWSSKNKGTRKSQKSVELATSKKNNFLDEFDKFEEQFENHLSKDSSNMKRHSVSHESKKNQQSINAQYNSLMKDLQAVTAKLMSLPQQQAPYQNYGQEVNDQGNNIVGRYNGLEI